MNGRHPAVIVANIIASYLKRYGATTSAQCTKDANRVTRSHGSGIRKCGLTLAVRVGVSKVPDT
eukprot:7724124-Karenia_brevis.AAC.1